MKRSLLFRVAAALAAFLLAAASSCSPDAGVPAEIVLEGPPVFAASKDAAGLERELPAATSYVTFSLTVALGESLDPGGRIRVEQGRLWNGRPVYGADLRYALPDPVLGEGPAANRLRIETEGSPFAAALRPAGLGRHTPEVTFPAGLPAGERVTFTFGDTSTGGPGLEAPSLPLRVELLTFVDQGGEGRFELAAGKHPWVECRSHGADRLRVIAPSLASQGRVRCRIVPCRGAGDAHSSSLPVWDFAGRVELFLSGESGEAALGWAEFRPGDLFKDVEVDLAARGILRIAAVCEAAGLRGTSNPVLVAGGAGAGDPFLEITQRILWGSLQNHTAIGGHAAGLPEEAFEIARGEAALDFCAITDHSSNPSFHWKELRELPDRFDEPGEFVAFAGYEWTSEKHGHRHVILRDGKGTIAASELPTSDPGETYAPSLADLARQIGSDPGVLIAVHHTTWLKDPAVPDFDFGFEFPLPRQRLFEVFSWHGQAEFNGGLLPIHGDPARNRRPGSSFRDLLAAGRPMAVTGDSDQHTGMPGIPVAFQRTKGLRYGFSGLTAVFAASFDRPGIFRALEEGRCYATTGARILVLFRLGGAWPGAAAAAPGDGPLAAEVEVYGTADLRSVQIFKDGNILAFEESPGGLDFSRTVVLSPAAEPGTRSYYLRVEQCDGHQAWTSPVEVRGG